MCRASIQGGEEAPSPAPRVAHALPLHPKGPFSTAGSQQNRQDHPSPRQSSGFISGAESRSRWELEASHCWCFLLLAGGSPGANTLHKPLMFPEPACPPSPHGHPQAAGPDPGRRVTCRSRGHQAVWSTVGAHLHPSAADWSPSLGDVQGCPAPSQLVWKCCC